MHKLLAILLLAGPVLSGTPELRTDAQIYTWIKNRMGITSHYAMPTIKYVTQAQIADMYRKKAAKHRASWLKQMGPEEIDGYINRVARDIRGLFDTTEVSTLYVANDTNTRIYQESVTAHELSHYLQQEHRGPAFDDGERFFREMEAEKYQREYIKEFCPKCDEMGEIKGGA